MSGMWIQNLNLPGAELTHQVCTLKRFGSHPNEECRNGFLTYYTDVMFGQKFLA